MKPDLLHKMRLMVGSLVLAVPFASGAAGLAIDSADSARIAALRQEAVAHEFGNGVPKDGARAAALYCEAARAGDADAQYALGWIHAYGRGVPRDDATAAFFFRLAADQGIVQAVNMLGRLPEPAERPSCMRDPAPEPQEPPPVPATPPSRATKAMISFVSQAAEDYRVPAPLIWAIIAAESGFNPTAVSPKNAQGLMQLIPETATRFRVKDPFDVKQNVRGGTAYLRWLLAYFQGDVALVAAAYNAGEGAVERYAGVPPFLETRAYVKRIIAAVGAQAQPFDASVVDPSPRFRLFKDKTASLR